MPIWISIDPKALRRLNARMLVEGIVRDLADRDHIARLVPRPDHKAWRSNGGARNQAQPYETLNFRGIPESCLRERQFSKINTFRNKFLRLPKMNTVANTLKLDR